MPSIIERHVKNREQLAMVIISANKKVEAILFQPHVNKRPNHNAEVESIVHIVAEPFNHDFERIFDHSSHYGNAN